MELYLQNWGKMDLAQLGEDGFGPRAIQCDSYLGAKYM